MMNILVLTAVLFSFSAFAQSTDETYTAFCGSKADVEEMTGAVLSAADLKELIETRSPLLEVLSDGARGVRSLLDRGSRDGIGIFGAVIVCGVLAETKDRIRVEGCYNLKTKRFVKDKGGIAACEKFMARLQN